MTKFRLSFVQPYKTVLSVLCKLTEKGTLINVNAFFPLICLTMRDRYFGE